ncbi:30S ribosomal protein S4e [miscellaneous Crenarchaeota group-15 archaeon DG-45]|uniref:Small ribosomal subunit protein eS4 n=1 Tax=miscellaneous Crenarchaeota group-15 archaeon DG-45 TaxID=1685127 RepID=A0A0M0BS23_9ARCH|nr:MAG: 30S ribosomal protein S4e [miscellaneous Crenarchaeota group-15 archaeon DG-45]
MGRKGPSRHTKREMSPRFWPIHRKEHAWSARPSPGPHPIAESLPLMVMVRDTLGYAETGREARMIIKQGRVLVDGRPRRDEGYPVGVMDIVELPDAGQAFRALPAPGGRLELHPIKGDEAGYKLCRIVGKTTARGGRAQLNLHDGRNVVPEDGGRYKVSDVLQLSIPDQEVLGRVSFEPGVLATVTGGRSQGRHGVVTGLGTEPGWKRTATVRTPDGEEIRTLAAYVFAVGSGRPLISLPGGA